MSTRKRERDKRVNAGRIVRFEVVLDAATAKALRELARKEFRSCVQEAARAITLHVKGAAK